MITYRNINSPQFTSDKKGVIVKVTFAGLPEIPGLPSLNDEEVTFCAMPTDVEGHGREIHAECIAGKYGLIADYVAPSELPKPRNLLQEALDRIAELEAKVGKP